MLTRREFLATGALAAGFASLERAVAMGSAVVPARLAPQRGPLALPPGFEQVLISRYGDEMDDGLVVPSLHDGMAAFAGRGPKAEGKIVLVRNHEITRAHGLQLGPFGPKLERLAKIDPALLFDRGADGIPSPGGTTTILFDPATRRVERQVLSLGGTGYNCAGGPTPWGTWITCEEWVQRANKECAVDHGWCFEVPADPFAPLAAPKRLPGMGRFRHEAVAVAPAGNAVYLTEDIEDGALYRFLPTTAKDLATGRLQSLGVVDHPSLDSRNWPASLGGPGPGHVPVGRKFAVRWIDLADPESPKDDLRARSFAAGGTKFARCEGIWHTGQAVYIAATTGGAKQIGQIWKYTPSPYEGTARESESPGTIELFLESEDVAILKNCDNMTASPWGELFVCEDGEGNDGVVRIAPDGRTHRFAMNLANTSELAGPTFSPDGKWFFVNIQTPGVTVAVTGPWETLPR